jgi:GNAT superfamily N-acetyltransferase
VAGLNGTPYLNSMAGVNRERCDQWLNRKGSVYRWVAVNDTNNVVGHIQVNEIYGHFLNHLGASSVKYLEISRLFVTTETIGTGIGRALLGQAVNQIQTDGLIPILRVSDYLTPAIKLYERTGWVHAGSISSAISDDTLLVMQYVFPT